MKFSIRLLACIILFALSFYHYIHRHNGITELRLRLPELQRELSLSKDETTRLRFGVERLEDPGRLMELLKSSEYSHLRQPRSNEVVVVD